MDTLPSYIMEHPGWVWGRLAAALVSAGILSGMAASFREFLVEPTPDQIRMQRAEMLAWPVAQGRLENLRIKNARSGKRSNRFLVWGEYRYKVAEREFKGDRLSIDGQAYDSDYYDYFEKKIAALAPSLRIRRPKFEETISYLVNEPVSIHYDPKKPESSILNNKDCIAPSWLWDFGVPFYFCCCFSLVGLGLAAFALRGPRMSWMWLLNVVGLVLLGIGLTMLLLATRQAPGEPVRWVTLVFLLLVGCLLSLVGGFYSLFPKIKVVVDPAGRAVRETYRHAFVPLLSHSRRVWPFSSFGHVRLSTLFREQTGSVAWRVELIPISEKDSVMVMDTWSRNQPGEDVPRDALDFAEDLARTTGLHLELKSSTEKAPPDPRTPAEITQAAAKSAEGDKDWRRVRIKFLVMAIIGGAIAIHQAQSYHLDLMHTVVVVGGSAIFAGIVGLTFPFP
ncbi:MAG: DUF3592 domain-containing protein [Deltaproteobacteria bacterium]|nr:DUF3592 domain-containing protein [Deltaproteobacteria bacterium]